MSDEARKVFPLEKVLAIVVGNENVDVKDVAGYLLGRSLECDFSARAVAPMAAGWLASLFPKFVALTWDDSKPWDTFVQENKTDLGDSVSIEPMSAKMKAFAGKTIDYIAEMDGIVKKQGGEIADLEARVAELSPLENRCKDLEKNCDQLEAKVKTMTTEMGGLRRDMLPFQGKMAIDEAELLNLIKTTIKDNMKGIVVAAGGAAGAAAVADAAVEEAGQDSGPEPDFGFGASGSDGDGFGF